MGIEGLSPDLWAAASIVVAYPGEEVFWNRAAAIRPARQKPTLYVGVVGHYLKPEEVA